MKNTDTKKNWLVLNAAIWGAVVFGGLTALFALCVNIPTFFYPLVLLAPIVNYIPELIIGCFDLNHTTLHAFLDYMEGAPFVILVNAVFGAFLFAIAAFLLRLSTRSTRQDGEK